MSTIETQTAFCFNCGQQVQSEASFCPGCGEAQSTPPPGQSDRGSASTDDLSEHVRQTVGRAGERLESVNPGGGELAGVLLQQVSAPGAVAALIATAAAVAVAAVMAVILGVLPVGAESIIVFDHREAKFVPEVLLQFGQLFGGLLVIRDGGSRFAVQTLPLLLVALPVLTLVLVTRIQSGRVASLQPVARLLWGCAAALPLAAVLLVVATVSKTRIDGSTTQLAVGSSALLGLLWGGLGGLVGAYLGLRRDGLHRRLLPPIGNQLAGVIGAAARSFGVALLVAAIGITIVVAVQATRGVGEFDDTRSTAGATVENSLFVVEHGVHGVALGTFAKFSSQHAIYAMPVPVTKVNRVVGKGGYRLTDYKSALPAWLFIVGLIALVAVPAFLALSAGFGCARAAGASTWGQRLAWGLVPVPIWGASMVALNALANKTSEFPVFGLGNGGSVLGMTVLFSGVLGVLGGALAGQAARNKQESAS